MTSLTQLTKRILQARLTAKRALINNISANLDSESLLAVWWGTSTGNWGDILTPILANKLSGKPVANATWVLNLRGKTVYSIIGSILQYIHRHNPDVWGSGFISSKATLRAPLGEIHAVRGPLTKEKLEEHGYQCPEIYGDPGLLAPLLFPPSNVSAQYKLGVVPHYKDRDLPIIKSLSGEKDINVINICGGPRHVVREIEKCRHIVSSSLHGLIAADAYNIPCQWIQLSNRVKGDGFKFKDYQLSVSKPAVKPLKWTAQTRMDDVIGSFPTDYPEIDLGALIHTCPFISQRRADELAEDLEKVLPHLH